MRKFLYFILSFLSPLYIYLTKKNLRVLAYHDVVDRETFAKQLKYLKEEFSIIDVTALQEHVFRNKPLPDFPLLVTFDDGDTTVYDPGSDLLKKYEIPACLFVVSGLINTSTNYWTENVRIKERARGKSSAEIRRIVNALKDMPNHERLVKMERYEATHKLQLTSSELHELNQNDVYIANHSHTHPMFNRCKETEIVSELAAFKNSVAEWGVGDYYIFAYPNGNYNDLTEEVLKANQVKLAFLFDHKINSLLIDPFRISRIRVDSNTPLYEFKAKVSGLHSRLSSFLEKLFGNDNN